MKSKETQSLKSRQNIFVTTHNWEELRIDSIRKHTSASAIVDEMIGLYLKGKVKLKIGEKVG